MTKIHDKIEFIFTTQSGDELIKSFQGYNTNLTDTELVDIANNWLNLNAFGTSDNALASIKTIQKEQVSKTNIER